MDSHREKNYLSYSLGISVFSPFTNLYQISKLYNIPLQPHLRLLPQVFIPQSILRYSQLHLSCLIKDSFNSKNNQFGPLIAFGSIGVLQGGIYGHANHYFSSKIGISSQIRDQGIIRTVMRGSGFAFNRDIISQGLPYLMLDKASYWYYPQFFLASISATYLSNPLHTCQVLMQTNTALSYRQAITQMIKDKSYFKGVESRAGLLLITNLFNELFLKPVWEREI